MTALIHQRCSNHPGREAAVRCPECGRFFCRECVTEHLGRMICAGCVARLAVAGGGSESRAPLLWFALAVGGVLFAWLIFYYLGMSLARIPSTFFAGSLKNEIFKPLPLVTLPSRKAGQRAVIKGSGLKMARLFHDGL